MAAAPRYKVFSSTGEYIASSKTPEIGVAAALQSGIGATVRDGYRAKDTVFTVVEDVAAVHFVSANAEYVREHAAPLGPVRTTGNGAVAVA